MSSRRKDEQSPPIDGDPAPVEVADDATTPADVEPASTTEPSAEEQLSAERDKNLRLMAELRNQQQRAERERQEQRRYAEADFARELLGVIDDLERAMTAAADNAAATAVLDGVRIVHEQFLKVLRGRSIEPVPAVGEVFNPDVHEALLQQPSEEVAAGLVLEEVARGYRMHERVLRPARVIVSSGPAKT